MTTGDVTVSIAILSRFFNRSCLWRCWLCCLNRFLATWAASVFMHFGPSVCSVALSVCLLGTRLSKHFSVVHSAVTFCAGDTQLLFKRPLKFRNVSKYTESRSSKSNYQRIPTALEVFRGFETKRNQPKPKEKNRSSTKTTTQRASNIHERTGCNHDVLK